MIVFTFHRHQKHKQLKASDEVWKSPSLFHSTSSGRFPPSHVFLDPECHTLILPFLWLCLCVCLQSWQCAGISKRRHGNLCLFLTCLAGWYLHFCLASAATNTDNTRKWNEIRMCVLFFFVFRIIGINVSELNDAKSLFSVKSYLNFYYLWHQPKKHIIQMPIL